MTSLLKRLLELPLSVQLEVALYPVMLIWRMPIAWAKSLWLARILLNGRWHRFMGFHPQNSLNSFFYRTQWLNLSRYGRRGISPILGLGAYPLKNWFHLSLISSYTYANAGAVTTLIGTLFWVFSHLIWMDHIDPYWAALVTASLFFSTTSYAMAFARQNYQILGWMWMPIPLYALTYDQWMLTTFGWFMCGLSGITPIFFAIPVTITMSLTIGSCLPFITLVPALVLTLSRFLPLLKDGGIKGSVIKMSKLIGLTSNKVRYQRKIKKVSLFTIYFSGLYMASAVILWMATQSFPTLPLLGIALFVLNQCFARVADEQSLIVIIISLFCFNTMQAAPNWLALVAFWIASSPFAVFLSVQDISKDRDQNKILVNAPFDHTNILDSLRIFFDPVKTGEPVYFAFSDPEEHYEKVFDGYRHIHEIPLYVASEKRIHLFPDWYAVSETNYEGAPQCWGRTQEEVIDNLNRWNARFAIVYQASGSKLASIWSENFQQRAEFDWQSVLPMLRGIPIWSHNLPTPKWFLIEKIT